MQLLKITTIPLEYDLNIQNAKLTAPQIEPAKLSQHTTPAAINLQTENAKVRMDSSAMRRSMGMKSIADVSKEAPVKTQETANKVTSDYVNMGNSMVKPGMTIAQFMKQKSLNNITIDTNIGAIPTEKSICHGNRQFRKFLSEEAKLILTGKNLPAKWNLFQAV